MGQVYGVIILIQYVILLIQSVILLTQTVTLRILNLFNELRLAFPVRSERVKRSGTVLSVPDLRWVKGPLGKHVITLTLTSDPRARPVVGG